MAQRIYWNYQQQLPSYELGRIFLGVLEPGRYRGFDTKAYTGMTLALAHTSTGIIQSSSTGTLTTKTGVYMSPQGSIIQEDAQITIGAVTANSSGNSRIDLIVAVYLKPVAAIGTATYQVITGTPAGNPVAPALPNPEKTIILGQLLVPNGTTVDLSTCTFTPANTPLLSNETRPTYYQDYTVNCSNNWGFIDNLAGSTIINIRKNLVTKTSTMTILGDLTNTVSASQVICTLPAGPLRPLQDLYIPVVSTKNDNSTQTASMLKITTAGVVTLLNAANAADVLVRTRGILISLD